MTGLPPDERPLNIQGLLGVGLDGRGGDLYVTRGENFLCGGGSRTTHRRMVDVALRFNDEVDRRDKQIDEINLRELAEITRALRERED